jgi:glycosyltransferase involved in cell wall biosynthesis
MKYCFVIPHFNHHVAFSKFLPTIMQLNIACIIVDDGSLPGSIDIVEALIDNLSSSISGDGKVGAEQNLYLLKHAHNRGKGAAFFTGAYYARTLGYTHAIQIDADGQHDINDVSAFMKYSQSHPETIVSGNPYFEDDAPKLRVYGRRVTDFWVALETLSFQIKDSLCGYRIYPLTQVEYILDYYHIGARMDFDTEILVKAVWLDIPLHFLQTKVIYPENSVSHFHYARDNFLLIYLHIRLMLGMLVRSPLFMIKNVKNLFR